MRRIALESGCVPDCWDLPRSPCPLGECLSWRLGVKSETSGDAPLNVDWHHGRRLRLSLNKSTWNSFPQPDSGQDLKPCSTVFPIIFWTEQVEYIRMQIKMVSFGEIYYHKESEFFSAGKASSPLHAESPGIPHPTLFAEGLKSPHFCEICCFKLMNYPWCPICMSFYRAFLTFLWRF